MRVLKHLAIKLGFRQPAVVVKPSRAEDDRVDQVEYWVRQHKDRKHIVACRNRSTIALMTERFKACGQEDVEVWSYHRLLTGIIFRDDHMALSATFTIPTEAIYRQLTARLKGADPLYYVVLDPNEKLSYKDYAEPPPRG